MDTQTNNTYKLYDIEYDNELQLSNRSISNWYYITYKPRYNSTESAENINNNIFDIVYKLFISMALNLTTPSSPMLLTNMSNNINCEVHTKVPNRTPASALTNQSLPNSNNSQLPISINGTVMNINVIGINTNRSKLSQKILSQPKPNKLMRSNININNLCLLKSCQMMQQPRNINRNINNNHTRSISIGDANNNANASPTILFNC